MKKIIGLLIIFALIFIVGCSHTNNESDAGVGISSEFPAPGFEDVPEAIVVDADLETGVKEFNVVAKKWEFQPSTIEVKRGDKVKLNINSVDVTHGFSLADFGINENLAPGKTTVVEFTADKTGTFTFFCSVYCGSGHSDMKGMLIVNE
ncbi:cupredoxin domain-containing protein [Candidatus Woesearchaeota archaeon]|nr:cupredoxin domain-containing protein [Candidatus Woesearchaeota archaeon]